MAPLEAPRDPAVPLREGSIRFAMGLILGFKIGWAEGCSGSRVRLGDGRA
jgi:hypothetical protein